MRRTVLCVFVFLWALAPVAAAKDDLLRVGLDFFPNPNHAPLYVAQVSGLFDARGLDVEIVVPANPSDPVKLAASRWLDVALTPQINYLIARSEGLPLTAIGALIDGPLGGLLALAGRGIESLEDLAGERVGYALAPLEPVLWRTMLECADVSVGEVALINVGFATMPSLLSGSVDAIGAFRNYETIQSELQGGSPLFFPQEDYCIPWTYDIILVSHPETIEDRADELAQFLAALSEGVARVQSEPETAFDRVLEAQPDFDDELNRRSYDATIPLFAGGLRHDAADVWEDLQDYLYDTGLIVDRSEVNELFTTELLPKNGGESHGP